MNQHELPGVDNTIRRNDPIVERLFPKSPGDAPSPALAPVEFGCSLGGVMTIPTRFSGRPAAAEKAFAPDGGELSAKCARKSGAISVNRSADLRIGALLATNPDTPIRRSALQSRGSWFRCAASWTWVLLTNYRKRRCCVCLKAVVGLAMFAGFLAPSMTEGTHRNDLGLAIANSNAFCHLAAP